MPATRLPILLQIAIEPCDDRDRPRLVAALVANDDGGATIDPQTSQIVIGGTSEAHIEAVLGGVKERAGVALNVGALQVAYRETIARPIEIDTTHKKPLAAGTFEFARVKLAFEPAAGWSFEAPSDAAFPAPFLAGVEAGLALGRRAGVLAGFPVVDVKARLVDGAWHHADSSPRAFEAATLTAFRHALAAVSVLMEPIMQAEVTVGAAFMGALRDDLLLRRGEIESRATGADQSVTFVARVPLANMLGYQASLRALSSGTGSVRLSFSHFAAMPRPEPPDFPGSMALRA